VITLFVLLYMRVDCDSTVRPVIYEVGCDNNVRPVIYEGWL
jgi:hypothetical protein